MNGTSRRAGAAAFHAASACTSSRRDQAAVLVAQQVLEQDANAERQAVELFPSALRAPAGGRVDRVVADGQERTGLNLSV